MPLQPFDLFSNETRLITHNGYVYKLKLIHKSEISQADNPLSRQKDEINTELSDVIRAVLFLIKKRKNIPLQIQTMRLMVWPSVKSWKIAQKLGFSKNGSRLKCGHVIELAFCLKEIRIPDDEENSEQSSQLSADSTLESDARNGSITHDSRVDLRRFVNSSNASHSSPSEDSIMGQQPENSESENEDQTASTGTDSPIKNFGKSCKIPIHPGSPRKGSDQSLLSSQTVNEQEDLTSNNSEENTASVQMIPTSNCSMDQSPSNKLDSNLQTENLNSYPKSIEKSLQQPVCNPEDFTSSNSDPHRVRTPHRPDFETSNLVSQSRPTIKNEPKDNQQLISDLNSSLFQINQTVKNIDTMNNNNNNNNSISIHSDSSEVIQGVTSVPKATKEISNVNNDKGCQQLFAVSSKETLSPFQINSKFFSSSTQTNFDQISSDVSISNLNENIPKLKENPADLDKSCLSNPCSLPNNQNASGDFPCSAVGNDLNKMDVDSSSSIFHSKQTPDLNQTPLDINNVNNPPNPLPNKLNTNMPTYLASNLNKQSTQMSDTQTSAKKLLVTDLTSTSFSPKARIKITDGNKCSHVIITKYSPELISNIVKSVGKSKIKILDINSLKEQNKMISVNPKEPTVPVDASRQLTFPLSSKQTDIQKDNSNPGPKNLNIVIKKTYSDKTDMPLASSCPVRQPVSHCLPSSSVQNNFDETDADNIVSNCVQKNFKVNPKITNSNLKVKDRFPNQEEALRRLPSKDSSQMFGLDPDPRAAMKQIHLTSKQETISADKRLSLTDSNSGPSKGKTNPAEGLNNFQPKKMNNLSETFQDPKTKMLTQQNLLVPNRKEPDRSIIVLPTPSTSCSHTNNINEIESSSDSSRTNMESHPYLKEILMGQTCLNSNNPPSYKPKAQTPQTLSSHLNNQSIQIDKINISKSSTQDFIFPSSNNTNPQNEDKSITGYSKDDISRPNQTIIHNLRASKFDILNPKKPASDSNRGSQSSNSVTDRGNENKIINLGNEVNSDQGDRSEAITSDSVCPSENGSNKENPECHSDNKEAVPKENSSANKQPSTENPISGPSCSSELKINRTSTDNNRIQGFIPDKNFRQILDVRPNPNNTIKGPLQQKPILSKNDAMIKSKEEKKTTPTDEQGELSIGMHDRYHVQTQDLQEDLKLQNLARPAGSDAKRKKYFWGYVDFDNFLPKAKKQK